jgi:hypothetical protein
MFTYFEGSNGLCLKKKRKGENKNWEEKKDFDKTNCQEKK